MEAKAEVELDTARTAAGEEAAGAVTVAAIVVAVTDVAAAEADSTAASNDIEAAAEGAKVPPGDGEEYEVAVHVIISLRLLIVVVDSAVPARIGLRAC